MAFQLHFFSLLANIVIHIHISFISFLFFVWFGSWSFFVFHNEQSNRISTLSNKERIFLEIKERKNVNKKIISRN